MRFVTLTFTGDLIYLHCVSKNKECKSELDAWSGLALGLGLAHRLSRAGRSHLPRPEHSELLTPSGPKAPDPGRLLTLPALAHCIIRV